jgi:hypothetical protein
LNAQPRLLDEFAVVGASCLAVGAAEGFGHSDEIAAFRFRDEACEREQLAALLAREARQVRAIGVDGP